ncbi:MAG TPA: universal stress protein, partial [Candidatus Luteococcus avicola]|nr:universal stress protein [Candidatus Luteococcus avicola]
VGEHNSTVPVETRVEVGSAGAALVEASHEAELVVVGTRGRSGLSGLLLGSTCREVVRRALCPVLVVPAPRT